MAPAPLKKEAPVAEKKQDHRFERRQKNFGIGNDIQPKRNLSRYIRWPKYVRLQRQKAILKKRLKVPPMVNQFNHTLDRNTATQALRLFDRYRPETKAEKRKRLTAIAEAEAAGKVADRGKKPINVKYGLNHITALIENKKVALVLIANDVEPLELVLWLPALCKKMSIPYAIIRGKARLGMLVHKKTATAVALTQVRPEDKQEFASILSAVKVNFSDKYEEMRKQWGGNILGFKSTIKLAKRDAALKKEAAMRTSQ